MMARGAEESICDRDSRPSSDNKRGDWWPVTIYSQIEIELQLVSKKTIRTRSHDGKPPSRVLWREPYAGGECERKRWRERNGWIGCGWVAGDERWTMKDSGTGYGTWDTRCLPYHCTVIFAQKTLLEGRSRGSTPHHYQR